MGLTKDAAARRTSPRPPLLGPDGTRKYDATPQPGGTSSPFGPPFGGFRSWRRASDRPSQPSSRTRSHSGRRSSLDGARQSDLPGHGASALTATRMEARRGRSHHRVWTGCFQSLACRWSPHCGMRWRRGISGHDFRPCASMQAQMPRSRHARSMPAHTRWATTPGRSDPPAVRPERPRRGTAADCPVSWRMSRSRGGPRQSRVTTVGCASPPGRRGPRLAACLSCARSKITSERAAAGRLRSGTTGTPGHCGRRRNPGLGNPSTVEVVCQPGRDRENRRLRTRRRTRLGLSV